MFILFEDGTIKVPEIWHPKYEVKMWAEVARQVEAFTDVQGFAILESESKGTDRPAAPSVIIIQRDGTVSVVKGKESYESHKKLIEKIEGSTGVRDVFRYRHSSIVMILLDGTVRSYGKPLCIPKIKNCMSAKLLTGSGSWSRDFMLQTEDANYVVSEYNGVVHKLKGIKKAVSRSWDMYMLTDDLRFFKLSWAEDDKIYKGFNNESTITDFWISKSAGFSETSVVVLYEDGYALTLAKSDMITAENAVVGHKYENGTLSFDIAEDKNSGGMSNVTRKPGASLELVKALSLQTMEMIYRRIGLDESRIIYQGENNIFSLRISRFDYTRVIEDPDFKRYAAATTDLARAALEEMAKVPKDKDIYYSIGEAAIMLSWKDVVSVVELGHMLNRYKVPSFYMVLGVSVSQDSPGYAFELDNDCTQFHVDTKKHTSIRNVIGACDYGRLFRNTESKQDRITLLGLLLADEARKFYPDCDWLPLRKEVPKSGEYTLDPFYKDLAEQFVRWHQKNHHRFGAGFFKNKTAIEWIDDFLLSYFPPKYPESTIQNCIFIDDGMAECCHFALDRM